jgi:signal transduction histidine kinase
MDIRTLLFANAVVFAVLATAMILVWRSNRRFPGLSRLARVHVTMMVGTAIIGIPPGQVPALMSMLVGNALVVLGIAWLLEGVRGLFALPRDRTTPITFLSWASFLLFFLFVHPSLRARLLTTNLAVFALLLQATWTARLGLRKPEERMPSWLLTGSLGLLALLFSVRVLAAAFAAQVAPIASDVPTLALMTSSLLAGTGWSFAVMLLVYARLNREANELERIKDDFVAVVSHELRTPLTSIRGSLGLLAGGAAGELSTTARSLVDISVNNCERLVRLINDILDMEKIESGKMAFVPIPVELTPLVEQAILSNRVYAHGFGVEIRLEDSVPGKVLADPDRLHQVMTNLLSNAARHSHRGGIVEIRIQRCGDRLRVSVTDHGEGIPPEFQPRVFEKFAQADTSSARREGGTGLGLSISRAIVERHGGSIGFRTEPGVGTTFSFELPDLDAGSERLRAAYSYAEGVNSSSLVE